MTKVSHHFDRARLLPVSLEISAVKVQGHVWQSPRNHRSGGLISFSGVYQQGSAGVDDARYIRWTLGQFLEIARVDSLVIDCTALDYQWGDDLNFPVDDGLPFCVVVRADQHAAYAYAVGANRLKTDLQLALHTATETIRAMKSRL
jgi:hypothetical protein